MKRNIISEAHEVPYMGCLVSVIIPVYNVSQYIDDANTADFIDESMAINDLSVVVDYLKASPDNKLYIAGMTATYGDSESCKELSLKRAEAVKSIIIQADSSIMESQMIVLGLGYEDNNLRVQDVINGEFIEEQAQKNRAVYILGENAPVIEQLVNISDAK